MFNVTLGSFTHWKRWDHAGRLPTKILNNQPIHQSYDFFHLYSFFFFGGWFLMRCAAIKRTYTSTILDKISVEG